MTALAEQQAKNTESIGANQASIAANQSEIANAKQMIAANQDGIDQVAKATNKRFSELTDWTVNSETTVRFQVGSYNIAPDQQQELADFAQQALKLKGYVIEVKGYADSTGNLADNQELSKQRAQAVVAYLLQDCHVPVKNIVSPGAMSESNPAASNETDTGRAENRRVSLRILVNKGVAGGS